MSIYFEFFYLWDKIYFKRAVVPYRSSCTYVREIDQYQLLRSSVAFCLWETAQSETLVTLKLCTSYSCDGIPNVRHHCFVSWKSCCMYIVCHTRSELIASHSSEKPCFFFFNLCLQIKKKMGAKRTYCCKFDLVHGFCVTGFHPVFHWSSQLGIFISWSYNPGKCFKT